MGELLDHFARTRGPARRRYTHFVAEGVSLGRQPTLQGGGLRRSAGGWAGVAALRRGRERWAADERILGSGPFVERLVREAAVPPQVRARQVTRRALPHLVARIARGFGVPEAELRGDSRRRPIAHARAAVSAAAVTGLGLPATAVARELGVTPMSILRGIERGGEYLRARGLDPDRLAREVVRKR